MLTQGDFTLIKNPRQSVNQTAKKLPKKRKKEERIILIFDYKHQKKISPFIKGSFTF